MPKLLWWTEKFPQSVPLTLTGAVSGSILSLTLLSMIKNLLCGNGKGIPAGYEKGHELTLSAYNHRPYTVRFKEAVSRLLSDLL